jgi:hypothetical protein
MPAACRPASSSKPTLPAAPTSAAMVLRARARSLIGAPCAQTGQGFDQGDVVRLLAGRVALLMAQVLHAEVAHRLCGLAHALWPGRPAGGRSCAAARRWPGLAQCGQHRQQLVTQRQFGQRPLAVALGPGLLQALVLAWRYRQLCVADQIVSARRNAIACTAATGSAAGLAGSLPGSRHAATASSSMAASPHHAQTFLAPPRSCTRTPGPARILRPAT